MTYSPLGARGSDLQGRAIAASVAVLTAGDSPELLGSGFFVAPGKVLTCAHVVVGVGPVQVQTGADRFPATVLVAAPPEHPPGRGSSNGDAPWRLPDLALLDVPGAPEVQAAWLDTSPAYEIAAAQTFMTCGFDMKGITARPTVGSREYDGAGIRQSPEGRLEVVELTGESVPLHRSGSMVWDPATGRVVAVLKASRARGDGLGGYAVPLAPWLSEALGPRQYEELMSAHDRFHARDRTWPAAAGLSSGGPNVPLGPGGPAGVLLRAAEWMGEVRARPLLEAALLGLIADVRNQIPPEETARIAAPHIRGYLPLGARPPLREAVLLLAGTRSPSATSLHDALQFMEELSAAVGDRLGAEWVRSVAQWSERCADEIGQTSQLRAYRHRQERTGPPARDRTDPVLRVHVRPDLKPGRGWELSVRLHYGDGEVIPVLVSEEPLQTAALWALLRRELQRFIAGLDSAETVLLDLILPMDLLDEPVHTWPTTDNREPVPIGHRLPVVVRAQERWQEEAYQHSRAALRNRWKRSALRGGVPIGWVMCEDAATPWLEAADQADGADGADDPEGGHYDMLGVTNPPGVRFRRTDRLIRAGVAKGLPALVWPTGGCGVDHDTAAGAGRRCSGQNFREQFHDVLGGTRLADLPMRLLTLRRSGTAPAADRMVLFWDDPAHACPDHQLNEPARPGS
jgi:hypothetical protein